MCPSWHRDREAERAIMLQRRQRGYDDGHAGLPARSTELDYQRGWRDGVAARERDLLLNDLDDDT